MNKATAAICAVLAALFVFVGIDNTAHGASAAWVLAGPIVLVLAFIAYKVWREA